MYQIKCDNQNGDVYFLHDSRSNTLKVIEPKCELELNKTGTLTFKVHPSHPYYNKIKKLKSEISLYQDGKWIFTGRVLNDEIDFHNFKIVEVEGELGYLLDSIQRAEAYHEPNVVDYFKKIISKHNGQMEDENKKFVVGKVDVDKSEGEDIVYKISKYKDTLSTINTELVGSYGGYIIPRNSNGTKYLDYRTVDSLPYNDNQVIRFGKNLIDLNKYVKGEEIATAIIPLGIKDEDESFETDEGDTVDIRLSIAGLVADDVHNDYIYDEEAVEKYGLIFKTIVFDDIDDCDKLYEEGKKQLKYYKQQSIKYELTALDLHLINVSIDTIKCGEKIKVVSTPHDLDKYLVVTKMSINIADPSKSTITLSTEERTSIDVNSISKENDNVKKETKKLKEELDDMDLSKYAKISQVNSAFNELSELIGGL